MFSLKKKFNKAMVTGGAGFVGSHLVEELLKEGLEVVSIDDLSNGKLENLEEFKNDPKLKIVECDVTDKEALREQFDGVDIVFHQACSKMTVCLKDPARDLEVNGNGTLNICLLAKEFGVKKIVHASSGSVYGTVTKFPSDESHQLNPVSYYGVSKLAGEKYVRAFHELYDMDTTILRYYHVFGPKQDSSDLGGVVSIFGRRVLNEEPPLVHGDGKQVRSFTFVKDVVNINLTVAMAECTAGEAYNCASGVQVSVRDLAEKVVAYYDSNVDIVHEGHKIGDIRFFDVDNSKIKSLGFDFNYNFEQGLASTLEWLKKAVKG